MLQYVFCLACRNFCLQLGLICVTKKEEEDFFFQLVNTEDGRAQEKKNRGEDSNAATHFRCSLHGARVSLASTGQLILQPTPVATYYERSLQVAPCRRQNGTCSSQE